MITFKNQIFCKKYNDALNDIETFGKRLWKIDRNLQTEELCLKAIKTDPDCFVYVKRKLQTEEMALLTVKSFGRNLEHVRSDLKTKEICLIAIKNDEMAFSYIPRKLWTEDFLIEIIEFYKDNFNAQLQIYETLFKYKKVTKKTILSLLTNMHYITLLYRVFIIPIYNVHKIINFKLYSDVITSKNKKIRKTLFKIIDSNAYSFIKIEYLQLLLQLLKNNKLNTRSIEIKNLFTDKVPTKNEILQFLEIEIEKQKLINI